jgi:2-methylcitrate dehydratase
MVAVPLIHGRLTGCDYEDDVAATRASTSSAQDDCVEDKRFSRTITIPTSARSPTRSRSSSTTAASTREVVVEYPIGHRRRRGGHPVLVEKFRTNLARRFPAKQQQAILDVALDAKQLEAMPVHEFVDLMVI